MPLIVVGLNHRTVPVDLLETMAVPTESLPKALHDLQTRDHLLEVVVLSTCNRTEIYALATKFHSAVGDVCDFLGSWSGADPEQFTEHLYSYYEDEAIRHLFSVAAGLDSMIVGEHEILGQVREAWRVAEAEHSSGQYVSRAFRHAIESGKRVRTETEIGRHPVSISSAAVAVAAERLTGLDGCRVVLLGAGEMGQGVASALRNRGISDLCIVNRTPERAESVATELGGRAAPLELLHSELEHADAVFSSTASNEVLIERSLVESAMRDRPDQPLLLVDIALPRDVDPGVADIEGVTLLDLDDLKDFAARSAERRRREITRVRTILDAELDRHSAEQAAREMAPVISALRSRADEIRRAEIERIGASIRELPEEAQRSVETITRAVVNKLLHEPSVRLKQAAGTDRGDLIADVLASLFDLEPED